MTPLARQAMRRYMLAFYRLLLWFTEREIVIARSTGRNPMNVLALRKDEEEYS